MPEGQTAELILASWYSPSVPPFLQTQSQARFLAGSHSCLAVLTMMLCYAVSLLLGSPRSPTLYPSFQKIPSCWECFFLRPLCQEGWGRVHPSIIVGYLLVAWVLVSPMAGKSLYNQAHLPDLPNPMSLMEILSLDDHCFAYLLCRGRWRGHV